ncbi:CinA family protein [Clavibacter capsici]|uniref:CinA family protein n=1 Tax=Clavibacter capsici TaxID=1874630 RepID=A0AAE6XRZ1_9MICO|nr:CinA family protein [Clavibacter capsici]ALD13181.1 damage-inducible protein CinA [Clavibacter capsici]QIS45361.1 CinA family protein [Clavibacter capsici]
MSTHDDATDEQLAERVIAALVASGRRLAVAESLTGGLLTAALVGVPGASRALSGGIVSYDTALKRTLLDVDSSILAVHGAVHPDVARQMARGVRQACAVDGRPADVGVATTGAAGPDPQDGQGPGTAFVGLSIDGDSRAVALHLDGDRQAVRAGVVREALSTLVDALETAGNI